MWIHEFTECDMPFMLQRQFGMDNMNVYKLWFGEYAFLILKLDTQPQCYYTSYLTYQIDHWYVFKRQNVSNFADLHFHLINILTPEQHMWYFIDVLFQIHVRK